MTELELMYKKAIHWKLAGITKGPLMHHRKVGWDVSAFIWYGASLTSVKKYIQASITRHRLAGNETRARAYELFMRPFTKGAEE